VDLVTLGKGRSHLSFGAKTQKAGIPKDTGLLATEAKITCASSSRFFSRLFLLFSWWPCFFLSFVFSNGYCGAEHHVLHIVPRTVI